MVDPVWRLNKETNMNGAARVTKENLQDTQRDLGYGFYIPMGTIG